MYRKYLQQVELHSLLAIFNIVDLSLIPSLFKNIQNFTLQFGPRHRTPDNRNNSTRASASLSHCSDRIQLNNQVSDMHKFGVGSSIMSSVHQV